MNGWTKWIGVFFVGAGMIATFMIFVADGRYFAFGEGVKLSTQQRTNSRISQEVLRGLKELNKKQVNLEKQYYRDKSDRQERENENLRRKIRALQARPRAQ